MMFKETGKLVLLVFSAFLGAFGNIAFAPHVHGQYYPAWGRAAWIGPRQPAAVAYYRKELVLASLPVKAHVQIAAPDGVDFYVNRKLLIGPNSSGQNSGITASMTTALASATFDIAPYLTVGKNVLAVKVTLVSRPAQPRLIVDGSWQDRGGTRHRIATDSSWRVVTRQEWQAGLSVEWNDLEFSALHWPRAAEVEEPSDRPMQYLDLPPSLFQDFPRGDWIWNRDRAVQQAAFRRTFNLQGEKINEAWIGVSSDAAHRLAINDLALSADTGDNSDSATEATLTTGSAMFAYDIARFLQWGENSVTLNMARWPPQKAPRLAVALIVRVDGKRLDFSSDGRWLSRSENPAGSVWTPVAVAGPMGTVPLAVEARASSPAQFGYPSLRILHLSPPAGWWLERTANGAIWFVGVLLANLMLVWLGARFGGWKTSGEITSTWALWTHAGVAGTLLLCFLFLLQYDVRVQQATVFRPAVFFAVWGITLLWAGVTLLVLRARGAPDAGPLEGDFNE